MVWMGRCLRWLGTMFAFLVFGTSAVVVGLVVAPLVRLLLPAARHRQAMRGLIAWAMRLYVRMLQGLGLLRYRITGLEHARGGGHCLIVANHPSLLDAVFLVGLFPHAELIAKASLARNPITALGFAAADYITNERPSDLLGESVRRLRAGASLIIFPEGTRSTVHNRPRFRLGAAAIAARAGTDILPVLIRCRPPTLGKHEPWYRVPQRRVEFDLEFGERVDTAAITAGQDPRLATRALNRQLEDWFRARLAVGTGHAAAAATDSGTAGHPGADAGPDGRTLHNGTLPPV